MSALGVKWVIDLKGDAATTPAVDEQALYITDSSGQLYKIDRQTGDLLWSRPISDYSGISGDIARTTPVISGDLLILGSQGIRALHKQGARIVALNKKSGKPVWSTLVEEHPTAVITQSAVVHDGVVFVGTSSWEEYVAAVRGGYECCGFRGSLLALDVDTGTILWQTYTVPDVDGFAGNAVWGSTPAIDPDLGKVYVTTGNSYWVPELLQSCIHAARLARSREDEAACHAGYPKNHVDSIIALDIKNGEIDWGFQTRDFDAYTNACYDTKRNPGNCPNPNGPDYDFAQGPILFEAQIDGVSRRLVGAGQKSGIYWMLDRDTGALVWKTLVGPGSALGGMEWGSASDGERIYTAVANFTKHGWRLLGKGADAGRRIRHGFWSALDIATGEILWQTADPNVGATPMGAVTVANGVVFAGSMSNGPNTETMFALDGKTGNILWRFVSGGSVNAGPAVVDGEVYWPTGYWLWNGRKGRKLYAFEIQPGTSDANTSAAPNQE